MTAPITLAKEVRTVDEEGRIALGAAKANGHYEVTEAPDGTITAIPVTVIPTRELWLHKNPEALASVERGLADAAAGRVSDGGDFTRYLDEED